MIDYQFDWAGSFGSKDYNDCYTIKGGMKSNQALVRVDDEHYLIDTKGKKLRSVSYDQLIDCVGI